MGVLSTIQRLLGQSQQASPVPREQAVAPEARAEPARPLPAAAGEKPSEFSQQPSTQEKGPEPVQTPSSTVANAEPAPPPISSSPEPSGAAAASAPAKSTKKKNPPPNPWYRNRQRW
jgi:hypothetical protein